MKSMTVALSWHIDQHTVLPETRHVRSSIEVERPFIWLANCRRQWKEGAHNLNTSLLLGPSCLLGRKTMNKRLEQAIGPRVFIELAIACDAQLAHRIIFLLAYRLDAAMKTFGNLRDR